MNLPATVTAMKEVRFCAGHRLVGHEGKCANLHGHNYRVQFFVSGAGTDELGRVVDFSEINRLFKGWIDENWDHGMVLWEQDQEAIRAIRSMAPHDRMYLLPVNPTAENMAHYLLTSVAPKLVTEMEGYHVAVTRVVLWETESNAAEVALDMPFPEYIDAHSHGRSTV